jgi:hypothetical protein
MERLRSIAFSGFSDHGWGASSRVGALLVGIDPVGRLIEVILLLFLLFRIVLAASHISAALLLGLVPIPALLIVTSG